MTTKPRTSAELLGDDPAPPKARGGRSANPHRDELFIQQARIAKLKADQLAGQLVKVAEVSALWESAIIDCRQRLLAVPARIATKHGLSAKQTGVIEAEIRKALEDLATSGGPAHAGKR